MRVITFFVVMLFAAALLFQLPLYAQRHAVSFGPVILGKPLPAMPDCPLDKSGYLPDPDPNGGACRWKTATPYANEPELYVENVMPGSDLKIVTNDCGAQDRWSCPVDQVTTDVPESTCGSVLSRLTVKFGAPIHRAIPMQNGFGARWTEHDYCWKFGSGDQIGYGTHMEIGGGSCYLVASTRAFRAASDPKQPEAKF